MNLKYNEIRDSMQSALRLIGGFRRTRRLGRQGDRATATMVVAILAILATPAVLATLAVLLILASPGSAMAQGDANVRYVFPLFVHGSMESGHSYRSTLKIARDTSNTTVCTVSQIGTEASLEGLEGSDYIPDVFSIGGSLQAIAIIQLDAIRPWEVLQSRGQSPVRVGFLTLSCSGRVNAVLQISLIHNGEIVSETAIAPAKSGKTFRYLVDERHGSRFGFTLVNASPDAGWYTVVAEDEFSVARSEFTDVIEPWSLVSVFVDEVLTLPSDFVGLVEIQGVDGETSFSAGIQQTGIVFSAVHPDIPESGDD